MVQDIRYALRTFARSPALVAAAVVCLALGIGANATIFGVVDTLLFKAPPHIQDPDRVVRLYFRRHSPTFETLTSSTTGYPLYTLIRDSVHAFDAVAAFTFTQAASLGRGADARRVDLVLASASYFPLLGVRPALGRFYGVDEDRIGGPSVAVLGYDFWKAAFGGDSGIVGRRLQLGRGSYQVVGVAPKHFTGVNLQSVDVWVPIEASTTEFSGPGALNRGSYFLQIIARLGARGRAAAEREATLAFRSEDVYSDRDSNAVAMLGPVQLARGPEISQNAKVSLWLAAVSVIVLLVACANVANLLLARSLARQREIAIRLALGSGWWRLTRQLLTESVVLALAGGIAALFVTLWAGPLIRALLLPSIPAVSAVDTRVLAFTAAVAILTGLLAGLAPAWQLRRRDLTPALKTGSGEGRYQRSRLRSVLLVGQVALTVVLLVGAGLFARSLRNVEGQDFGFDPEHTLLATMDLRAAGYGTVEMNQLQLRMLTRLEGLPGVEAAAATIGHPFGWATGCSVSVPGRDSIPQLRTGGPYCQQVTAGYFAAMGAPVRGRAFTPADRSAPVAIVNETMARLLWPAENALGKCFVRSDERCHEIVGVVSDARRFNAVEDASMLFYVPFSGDSSAFFITALVLRVRGQPEDWVAPVRDAIQGTAANLPYARVTPLADLVAPSIRPWRLGSTMFGAFALLALVLSAVGLYGVLAYTVAQRTHEMGVRVAMGAQRRDVLRLMIAHGVGIAALGAGLGALIALAGGQLLSSLMFGVSPRDPLVLLGAALLPIVVAAIASCVPAWRASRVDPVVALRYE
jgi:predicted permease